MNELHTIKDTVQRYHFSDKTKNMKANGDELIGKLELFVRKYYNNIAVRGCILFAAILLALFLTVSLFEYFAYSNTVVRTCIFYGFLLLNAGVLTGMILLPLFRKAGWLKRLSYEEAARLIGKHFPEIDDKLLNTLQLHELSEQNPAGYGLLNAAIDRRITQMKPFVFHKAVDFKKNLRYLKYAAVPALVILLLLGWNSELFTGPTNRIIHHQTVFEKPAPYRFEWTDQVSEVLQDAQVPLHIRVRGKETPEELFVLVDGVRYRMERISPVEFQYELKRLRSDTRLRFESEEVQSQEYDIRVLPKPNLLHFSVTLDYPAYLHKITETVDNNGNITVPQGTRITWKFHTANADEVRISTGGNETRIPCTEDHCTYKIQANSDFSYQLFSSNRYLSNQDSLQYNVSVIPDAYPEIRVEQSKDSLYFDRFYFKGDIRDDYGFLKLRFMHYVTNGKDTVRGTTPYDIPFQPESTVQGFHYYFDAQTLSLSPGESLHYYFEVWDNDGVNGSKRSRTSVMEFRLPTAEEIKKQSEEVSRQTQEGLSQTMKENEALLQRIEDLKKKMVNQKEAGWQEKKELESLIKQWQELKDEMQQTLEEQRRQQETEAQYETVSEEILQKQEELQKRMEELFSDEMKQTMMELQRLMEKDIDKEKLNEALEKIKMSTEELNKQLDQDLSLFKRLEVEQKMESFLEQAEALAKKQLELAKESESGNSADQERKQQQLENEFDQLMEDAGALRDMNKKLEDPFNIPEQKELEKSIRKEMQQAKEQLQQKKNKNASPHQKKAGEQMQQMQQQMEESFQKSMEASAAEDVQSIRKILNHIVQTSFQQEKIMKRLAGMNIQDPQVKNIIREQFALKDNLRQIEDSIAAIAKRQQAVKPFVHKQITKINSAQQQIISAIDQSQEQIYFQYRPRNFNNAVSKQQYVMTALNDLALMLAESMNNIQQQQQQGSKGGSCKSGQCKKGSSSGGNNPKDMKSLREMQEQLNKQLEEMRKQQGGQQSKEGQGKKQGQTGSQSEQFARMAARQEAIRRMTQEHLSKLQKEGRQAEAGNLQRMMKEMEQTEKELVNKILNQETINRQKNITTRMLQSERAEMQREKDDKRESRQGREVRRTPPPDWIKEQERQQQQTEMYKTLPPSMAPFYKQKANHYFYHFE